MSDKERTCLITAGEHGPHWRKRKFGNELQTFIKPADLQINLEAKSKPGGQNALI